MNEQIRILEMQLAEARSLLAPPRTSTSKLSTKEVTPDDHLPENN
jgi:hypothetical protein